MATMMASAASTCFHHSDVAAISGASSPSSFLRLPPSSRPTVLPSSLPSSLRPRPTRSVAETHSSSSLGDSGLHHHLRRLLRSFDPRIPLPQARTPPSSWYTDPSFLHLEFDRVFFRGWQVAGYTEQVQNPRDFFAGRLGTVHFMVCRDAAQDLRAFHNVCRHHAALLVCGSGQRPCFVCPYHGWTYGLDGSLLKATRIDGIQDFSLLDYGLIPLSVTSWGPFILIKIDTDGKPKCDAANATIENEWLGDCSKIFRDIVGSSLSHVCRRRYVIECNWKVFCDNYLDGGYHVPYAHGDLASGLKLDFYSTEIFVKASIQHCETSPRGEHDFDRLGSEAFYAFVYPNFMINRYGPWMDTNLVLPLNASKCEVIFDYFLDSSLQHDDVFVRRSLEESEKVQMEDIELCEQVQKGLASPAYCSGRYAPNVEKAMHHFHCLHHDILSQV